MVGTPFLRSGNDTHRHGVRLGIGLLLVQLAFGAIVLGALVALEIVVLPK